MVRIGDRDATFDLAKALAIFMVVYWHVMSYRTDFELATTPSYAANFIIVVNMPMFFMISGFFSRRLHEGGCWIKLLNRFIMYFWPMAISKLFFICYDSLVLGEFPITEMPFRVLRSFLFQGWFFQSLAFCDAITFITFRFDRLWQRVSISLLGYAICLVGSGRLWYVGNVVPMIPFYWFGLIFLPYIVKDRIWFAASACLGACVMIIVTFFCGNVATNGLGFYWDKFDVLHPEMLKAANLVIRLFVGGLGSLAILWGLRTAIRRFTFLERLAPLGQETLGIFFLQGWLIFRCVVPFVGLDADMFVLLLASLGVCLLAFSIVKLLKTYEWSRRLAFGIKFGVV